MSLFRSAWTKRLFGIAGAQDLIPSRHSKTVGSVNVTNDTAMRHSAVWACLRLRANMVSTMPVDVFSKQKSIDVPVPTPPVLVTPGGEKVGIKEWLYSTQVDLDRAGNCFGLITERNSLNLPSRIDLQPLNECTVLQKDGVIRYRIAGIEYPAEKVWHEKQYTLAGLPVGLSPVAYAAWSIGQYLSAQEFANEWFGTGAVPKGHFRNTQLTEIAQEAATKAKADFKTSIANNDIFVSGKDWEYLPFQAQAVGAEWLETQKYGIGDVARFFDCPGDLIDAVVSSGNITYANVTQRNLQFLIMHLAPAIVRREDALSTLLPRPRFVKLNSSAILRMDDLTRAQVDQIKINSRTLAPSEAREHENLPPFTEPQLAEFDRLFGPPKVAPVTSGTPGTGS